MAHQYPPPSATSGHRNPPNPNASIYSNPLDAPLRAQRNPAIYHLSFDEDFSCFSVGLDTGFRIYTIDPFNLRSSTFDSVSHGGIGLVTMRSDYLCLVGGGPDPLYQRNKVMICDSDNRPRELEFGSEVKNVKLRQDRLVVVTVHCICVYNCADLNLDRQIETCMNPRGVCEVSCSQFPMVVAYPSTQIGHIRVDFPSNETTIIQAYDSMIACIAMTSEAHKLACACDLGNSIKIFNTHSGELQHKVVTGYVRAEIYSLAFCSEAKLLVVSTDSGCVQLYSLGDNPPNPTQRTPEVAHFPIRGGLRHFVAFGHERNTLVIIGMNGCFYRCKFDPNAGKLDLHTYLNFMAQEITLENLP